MAYKGGSLADLADTLERGVRRFGRRGAEAVGKRMHERVQRHTPVAAETAAVRASFGSLGEWVRARGGRRPGELRDSWKIGEVEVRVQGSSEHFRVPIYTLDPVAPYVEWETRPHLIVPRQPGRVLTIPTPHGMVYATSVHHPGTRGAHMMATASAEIAAEWRDIITREWREETRGFWERHAA